MHITKQSIGNWITIIIDVIVIELQYLKVIGNCN